MSVEEAVGSGSPMRRLWVRGAGVIATVGGVGLVPVGAGTAGSLVAVTGALLWITTAHVHMVQPGLIAAAITATVVGVWASHLTSRTLNDGDPSRVVIDEVAGQLLAVAMVPGNLLQAAPWTAVLGVFALFRFFDILKPWPLSCLERLPGGVGIMSDDLGAGMAAGWLTVPLLV